MADTINFRPASQAETESANMSNSLSSGTSPFQQGVVFTITGYRYECLQVNGKDKSDAKPQPVLVTSVGSLFVKSLLRSVVKDDGSILEHNGTFNTFVKGVLANPANKDKNDGQILQLIVDDCKDKQFIVNRVPYSAKAKDGHSYAAALVDVDFKVD